MQKIISSKIKKIHIVGRRGPLQAKFTPVELREMGELENSISIIDKETIVSNK